MIDERSAKHLDTLLPEVRNAFADFLIEAKELVAKEGLDYKIICGTRSWEQQEALYAKGRTAPGPKVTNAKPGSSMHNFGIAIDCGVFKGKVYMDDGTPADKKIADMMHKQASTLCAKHNLRWGGNFKSLYDAPHFEYNTPHSLAELCSRREAKKSLIA
jgi:peptidoglycan L-alanyl-D-glutamate endopeptidase CwlK